MAGMPPSQGVLKPWRTWWEYLNCFQGLSLPVKLTPKSIGTKGQLAPSMSNLCILNSKQDQNHIMQRQAIYHSIKYTKPIELPSSKTGHTIGSIVPRARSQAESMPPGKSKTEVDTPAENDHCQLTTNISPMTAKCTLTKESTQNKKGQLQLLLQHLNEMQVGAYQAWLFVLHKPPVLPYQALLPRFAS